MKAANFIIFPTENKSESTLRIGFVVSSWEEMLAANNIDVADFKYLKFCPFMQEVHMENMLLLLWVTTIYLQHQSQDMLKYSKYTVLS